MQRLLKNNLLVVLFCMGCLSALAMAPVYAWILMAIGYSVLLSQLDKQTSWKASALLTFIFFFGYFLTSFYWISNSLFVDLDRWWWALPFSFIGLPLILSLFPTFLVLVAKFISKNSLIAVIIAFITSNITRSYLFTGFSWNLPAHTWANTEIMMHLLPYIGFFGLNSLTIILFCLPYVIYKNRTNKYTLVFITIVLVGFVFTASIIKTQNETIKLPDNIIMVQGNIPQNEKWFSEFVWRNFDRYISLSNQAIKNEKPQIIIWPETAISSMLIKNKHGQMMFLNFLNSLPKDSVLITGILTNEDNKNYNALRVYSTKGQVMAEYKKNHLVPFGEYMPFGLDTLTGFNGFQSGELPKEIRLDNLNFSFLPLICYEIIFPKYSRKIKKGNIILNITNDAWFGKTAGPYQHFDHAKFRAAENKTPVIRLSGNGFSGTINADGTVKNITDFNKIEVLYNK